MSLKRAASRLTDPGPNRFERHPARATRTLAAKTERRSLQEQQRTSLSLFLCQSMPRLVADSKKCFNHAARLQLSGYVFPGKMAASAMVFFGIVMDRQPSADIPKGHGNAQEGNERKSQTQG
jgi:hypothetical protein